jgi:acetoacetate decarboxylase
VYRKEKSTPCKDCKWVDVLPENLEVWNYIVKYNSIFLSSSGMGGFTINAEAIRLVFDVENVPLKERSLLLMKLVSYYTKAISQIHEKDK